LRDLGLVWNMPVGSTFIPEYYIFVPIFSVIKRISESGWFEITKCQNSVSSYSKMRKLRKIWFIFTVTRWTEEHEQQELKRYFSKYDKTNLLWWEFSVEMWVCLAKNFSSLGLQFGYDETKAIVFAQVMGFFWISSFLLFDWPHVHILSTVRRTNRSTSTAPVWWHITLSLHESSIF
jgi:hypothetical protein